MGRIRKWTNEDIIGMLNDYQKNMTVQEILDKWKVSKQQFYYFLEKAGIQKRENGYDWEKIKKGVN